MMRPIRHLWNVGAAVALLCVAAAAPAAAYGPDPVEDLRQALRVPVRDTMNREELAYRRSALEKRAQALSVGDIRRALMLQEWRDEDRDEAVASIDRTVREALVSRLVKTLQTVLKTGSTPAKLAAVTQIAEIGTTVRAPSSRSGLARDLAPALIEQLQEGNSVVKQAAAIALGKINPEAKPAAAALGNLLVSGNDGERRAAAGGLAWLLRTVVQLTKGKNNIIEVTQAEVTQIAAAVVPQAGRGLRDSEVAVRRFCLEAIQLGAQLLAEQISDTPPGQLFPPPGRKASKDELTEMEAARAALEQERARILPLARGLDEQAMPVAQLLGDPVAEVRYLAAKALEEMGVARQKMVRKTQSVPPPTSGNEEETRRPTGGGAKILRVSATRLLAQRDDGKAPVPPSVDPLRSGLSQALPLLAARLSDPNVRVRLAAIDAIEQMGPLAAAIVPDLVRGLADPDLFVRWATARTLMKIGVVRTDLTVAPLAKLLCDPDLDVRLGAAATLGFYGVDALPAVPALAKAMTGGDADQRIAAIHAVQAIGRGSVAAIPALIDALAHRDARVRAAAATALGIYGPAAGSAVSALEKALFDTDENVRKAASDSLLAITAGQ